MASVPKSHPAGSIEQAPVPRSFPSSRKVYIAGSRPDLCVPMREIRLCDSRSRLGPIAHDAVTVYDTSGPYTDPAAHIDLRAGLPPLRERWIAERGDVEEQPADGESSEPAARSRLMFARPRPPWRAKIGANVREWILRNYRYIGRWQQDLTFLRFPASRFWPGPATCLDPCRGTIESLAGTNAAEASETSHASSPTVIDTRKALGAVSPASAERPRRTGARSRKGEGKRAGERLSKGG